MLGLMHKMKIVVSENDVDISESMKYLTISVRRTPLTGRHFAPR